MVAVAIVLPLLSSCLRSSTGGHRDEGHCAEVDSVMRGMEDVDSISAMVEQYRSQGDATGEMLALKHMGSRLRKLSRYDDALEAHNHSLKLATHLADTLEMMAALNNIATDYRRKSELSQANGYHLEALKLSDLYSDHDSPQALKSRVVTLNGIGNIEIDVCNYVAADSVLHLALMGEQRLGSHLGMAINYANIGAVKRALGQTDSAWFYYRKSLESNQLADSQEGEALCHLHFGELYEDERSFSRARTEYKLAYDNLKGLGESFHWLAAELSLARVSMMLGELAEARQYVDEAQAEAKRIENREHLAEAYRLQYDLSLLDGDVKKALDYYVESQELQDSIFGLEKSDEMRRQRVHYQSGQRSWELKSLNDDIARLKRMRNIMGLLVLALLLMIGAIIAMMTYAMRMRSRTQHKLRQVEETRSLFFTNVVHQLRTPLTAIMGATDSIIGADAAGDEAARRENIEIIERQGKNLLELVDRILQVGGVRSAIHEPEWRTGDVVPFVRMVVESYHDRCVGRHIELTYTPREANVTLDMVPGYLNTILGSFIENAIDYSQDYSKITVSSRVEKDHFIVEVTDAGIGIAQGDLPHVFEPFYRGAVAERLVEGVGIGLTVARDMAMAMDGQVSVTSEKDHGSCFTVSLPLKHGNAVKQALENIVRPVAAIGHRRQKSPADIITDTAPTTDHPTILVVEDHADVAHLVEKVLEHRFTVHHAADGKQAMAKLETSHVDLIITDVKMPVMDGHELCRRVRTTPAWRTIPIIMLSARTAEADRLRGIEAGADAYLLKPFSPEELLAWVNRLLESRRLMLEDSRHQQGVVTATVQEVPVTQGTHAKEKTEHNEFLDRFKLEVEKEMGKCVKLDFDKIAHELKMGESQLRARVQQSTGKSVTAYVTQLRMERAMQLLKSRPDMRIGDVAEQCGFLDVAYFSRVFRQYYGMTPTLARNGGQLTAV